MLMMLVATWCAPLQAAYIPISITGYNQDMIVESGALTGASLAGTATTASMDVGAGNTQKSWYEIGYDTNTGQTTTGLPSGGVTVASEAGVDHSFRLADDYTASNAVLLDSSHTTASLTLSNPLAYSSLSVLTSSGHGPGTIGYTIHYADGTTSIGTFNSNDWFNSSTTAITAHGRVDVQTGAFDSEGSSNPRLYQADLTVANPQKNITSVDLAYITGQASTHTAVMALSGVASKTIFSSGDSIAAYNSSGTPNSPTAEQVPNAIDGDINTKYLNSNKTDPGLTVTNDYQMSVVKSLILTSANDAPQRDPASYVIQGSNDLSGAWTNISSGAVPTFTGRHVSLSIDIANTDLYSHYRVYFPSVVDSPTTANSMQIAEVNLAASQILQDVTGPGTIVTVYNSSGTPDPKEPTEGIAKAIDNDPNTKYLNFNKVGAGLTFELSQAFTVQGVGIRTANDSPERDPASFTLQGSNDGVNFVDIVTDMAIDPISTRFYNRNYAFDNDTAYLYYRLFFPTVANDATANSMQVGEIQLFAVIPTPTALPAGLMMLGLAAMRRRSR